MSEQATVNFVEVCAQDDIWIGEMMPFEVSGRQVIVLNVEGELVAYDGICPHQSVALAEGDFDGCVLTCRAHQWTFDAKSGRSINPSSACLTRFPIRIEQGMVLLGDQPVDAAP